MNPLEELCKFVLSIMNSTPKLLKFVDGGAVINGDYFIWPLDGYADEYGDLWYAINPYTGEVYELPSDLEAPDSGIRVNDPELIVIIYDYLNDYLAGYEASESGETIIILAPPYRIIKGIGIICLT